MFDFQLVTIFWMVTTLCDGVDTPKIVGTNVEDSQEALFNQPLIGQVFVGDILVDLPIGPLVDGLHVGRILDG
jgi:hypothetical protein